MTDNNKDDKNQFEFIKEQIIEKKYKKLKKTFHKFLITFFMAITFGIVAAITFCIAEPMIYNFVNKDKDVKTPVTFPTKYPEAENPGDNGDNTNSNKGNEIEVEPVIVEKTIEADLEDYVNMYKDIREVAFNARKSLVRVSGIIDGKDWFGKSVDKKMYTTGVVIANNKKDLLVLVSLDRIKDAGSIKIEFADMVEVDAVLHDYETDLNLAVLAVSIKEIPEIYMNNIKVATLGESYTIAVGSPVIAIGSPNGNPFSMDVGMISSKGNTISITDNRLELFHTNLHNNNNGDGIIIDLEGEVIGIITRTLKDELSKDLHTSVGISRLKDIMQKMANKTPRRYFGIKSEDMTEAAKKEHGVDTGIYVYEVEANSPAFLSGLKSGDIILEIEGLSVLNTNSFYHMISEYKTNQEINVKIKRYSSTSVKEMELKVTIVEKNQ